MGMETAAMLGVIASVAGAGTSAISALSRSPAKAKTPAGLARAADPGPDEARNKLEEEERLRQRRGRAVTLLQGESGPSSVATTQSGGRTVLG